jgi:molybdopterin-containing oxidoreductase family membrane subunit
MWFERFVIIVPSLSHEFEPWQWSGTSRAGWTSRSWRQLRLVLHVVPAVHQEPAVIAIAEVKEIVPPVSARMRTGRHRRDRASVDYSPETPGERD